MVKRCMRAFNIPIKKHDWVQKWCTNVHNHLSSCNHDWRTSLEVRTGNTPDILAFWFHVWEPIWLFDLTIHQPGPNLKKARWLGISWSAGDALTYYIQTEKERGPNVTLI